MVLQTAVNRTCRQRVVARGDINACLGTFADATGLPVTVEIIHELTSPNGFEDAQGDGRHWRIAEGS